jgi:hypothetical protein
LSHPKIEGRKLRKKLECKKMVREKMSSNFILFYFFKKEEKDKKNMGE